MVLIVQLWRRKQLQVKTSGERASSIIRSIRANPGGGGKEGNHSYNERTGKHGRPHPSVPRRVRRLRQKGAGRADGQPARIPVHGEPGIVQLALQAERVVDGAAGGGLGVAGASGARAGVAGLPAGWTAGVGEVEIRTADDVGVQGGGGVVVVCALWGDAPGREVREFGDSSDGGGVEKDGEE